MTKANDICEEQTPGGWVEVNVSEVLSRDTRGALRCVECHGPVRAHKEANNGMRAHFEHLRRHTGCSQKESFNGTKSLHPDALH